MINRLSHYLANFLFYKTGNSNKDILQYGINAFIYTLISTTLLLLFGLMVGQFVPSLIIISIYYINQTIGGGFHANTHIKCFITMLLGQILGLFLSQSVFLDNFSYIFFSHIGLSIMLIIPVVLHPNKSYLEARKKELIYKSRVVLLIEFVLTVLSYYLITSIFKPVAIALLLSGFSRTTGFLIAAYKKKES